MFEWLFNVWRFYLATFASLLGEGLFYIYFHLEFCSRGSFCFYFSRIYFCIWFYSVFTFVRWGHSSRSLNRNSSTFILFLLLAGKILFFLLPNFFFLKFSNILEFFFWNNGAFLFILGGYEIISKPYILPAGTSISGVMQIIQNILSWNRWSNGCIFSTSNELLPVLWVFKWGSIPVQLSRWPYFWLNFECVQLAPSM